MTIRLSLGITAVFTGWLALLAAVMVVSDDAPAALVVLPPAGFVAALPAGVAVTGQTALGITVTGEARALYQAGAWLVLPAGLLGCAPLTS